MSQNLKVYALVRHSRNLLKVGATFGGQKKGEFVRVNLLVDTGSSYTILPVQALFDLGYDLNNPIRRQEIVTGSGRINAPVVGVSWFNCSGKVITNFEVVACNLPPMLRVDGLLGMDFLIQNQAIIAVAKAEVYYAEE